ncbi:hypothetical protein [Pseudoduganella flava]|uniref:Uncharacterized protein n=2 Tax=Pseudoduganella flava TaxID=871742 RepID=A0ABX6FYU8_9BURK|nr:hypothetical protein [Pseudoduganella flava]QGZ42680.1 hypothetical protein GO485_29045 [Pseudoduganella flava]
MMVMANATDEILVVECFAREDGDWIARCPHCLRVVGMNGEEPVRGEQFQDRVCGGWFEVSSDASRLKRLPQHPDEDAK